MLFRDGDFSNLEGHFLQMGLKGKEIKQASIMLEKKLEGRCVFWVNKRREAFQMVSLTSLQLPINS